LWVPSRRTLLGDDPTAAPALIPVLLDAVGWNPDTQPLTLWLTDAVHRSYLTSVDGGTTLRARCDRRSILPIIDGFDELTSHARRAAVNRLSLDPAQPLIVTCRDAEYADAVAEQVVDAAPGSSWTPSIRPTSPDTCRTPLRNPRRVWDPSSRSCGTIRTPTRWHGCGRR